MDTARLKSIAVLGYYFNVHILKSVFGRRKKNQAELFRSYFREDRLTGLTLEEHESLAEFERCVACGLCPAHCRVMELSEGRFKGPMHLAVTASRSFPDFIHDLDSLLLCAACGQCEPICPEGVPVSRVTAAMRAMIWRVAPEALPGEYHKAKDSLERHGNIYGEPAADRPANPSAEAAYVLGPAETGRTPLYADQTLRVLKKLGYDLNVASWGSADGVARSMGLEPDTAWIEVLAASPARKVICSSPDLWQTLKDDPRLKNKQVLSLCEAVMERLPEGFGLGLAGPAAVHDPGAYARDAKQAALARNLLAKLGVELVEMDPTLEYSPPLGWEGGLDIADPVLAAKLVSSRCDDAEEAGASRLIAVCPEDAAALKSADGSIESAYLIEILDNVLS